MSINNNSEGEIVCVIGLEYVGFPSAKAFSRRYKTIGFDVD